MAQMSKLNMKGPPGSLKRVGFHPDVLS